MSISGFDAWCPSNQVLKALLLMCGGECGRFCLKTPRKAETVVTSTTDPTTNIE